MTDTTSAAPRAQAAQAGAGGWLCAARSWRHQRPVGIDLASQKFHFRIASDKSLSVLCNHCCPFDNVAVEGFESICNTAAGSGAGLGLRAVSCNSALCVCAQPLSNSKISASNGVAHRL